MKLNMVAKNSCPEVVLIFAEIDGIFCPDFEGIVWQAPKSRCFEVSAEVKQRIPFLLQKKHQLKRGWKNTAAIFLMTRRKTERFRVISVSTVQE